MKEFIGIKYKLSSSDNFDVYLKYIEVGLLTRKLACSVNPVCVLTEENGVYTFFVETPVKNTKMVFKPNEEFDEDRLDGKTVKSIFTIEGNKLIQVQIESDGRTSKHVREFSADKIVVTTTCDGWDGVCTRVYERVQ